MVPDIPSDANALVGWLDEQRQADHETIVDLARLIEQLRGEVHNQGEALAHLAENQERLADDQPGDLINQLFDRVAIIERALGEHFDAAERAEQIAATQQERELRQFGDLSHQVSALSRASEAATGRLGAIGEELRRARDERAPLIQELEDIHRIQSSLQDRLAIADETARRFSAFQSIAEQSGEKQRDDLVRLDGQQRLLDLRLNRELSDIRQAVEDWMRRGEDRMRPLAALVRQIAAISDQGEIGAQRIASLGRDVEAVTDELGRIEALNKIDRAALKRAADTIEAHTQRIDEAVASLWQLNERINATATNLEDLRNDLNLATQRIDEAERRIARLDDERQRAAAMLDSIESELHLGQRDSRDQSGSLRTQIDSEVAALRAEIASIRVLAAERLRRTVEELHQQLREMDVEQA